MLRTYCRYIVSGMMLTFSFYAGAQRIRLEEGSIASLGNVRAYAVQFSYDSMTVSRKHINEQEYVNNKIDELNEHRRNQGDNWAAGWRRKRGELYEPAFMDALREGGISVEPPGDRRTAKYIIVFKTTHVETGYNIGIKRRSSRIDGEAWIVETARPETILAKISVKKCLGKVDDGYDFNTGQRLAGSYEVAGSGLARFLREGD